MRYNKPIYFQSKKKGEYDPTTGNYGPETCEEAKRYAAITDTGTETLKLIYGDIKQRALTIRLQRPYEAAFDCIRIGEDESAKYYRVDMAKLHNRVFIVSEVQ